jgi:WD40 repeat protein
VTGNRKLLASPARLTEVFAVHLDFTKEEKHEFAGGADKSISMLHVETGKLVRTFPKDNGGRVCTLRLCGDGKSLFAIYSNELDPDKPAPARVWNVGSGTVTRTWEPGEPPIGGTRTRENQCLVASTATKVLRIESLA